MVTLGSFDKYVSGWVEMSMLACHCKSVDLSSVRCRRKVSSWSRDHFGILDV